MKQELWSICFSRGDLVPPHLCHIQHLTGFRRGFHRFKASSGASSSPGSCVGGPRRWYVVKWSVMPQNGPHIQTSLHIQQLAAFFSWRLLISSEATEEAKTFESPLIIVATGHHLLRDKKSCRCGAGKVRKIPSPGCCSMLRPWNGSKPHQGYVRWPRDPQATGPRSSCAHLGAVSPAAVVCPQVSIPACAGRCFRHRHKPAHVGEVLLSRQGYHRAALAGGGEITDVKSYWVNSSLQIQP